MAKRKKKVDTMAPMAAHLITPKTMMKMDAESLARSAMRASKPFQKMENAIEKAVMAAADGAMKKHMGRA